MWTEKEKVKRMDRSVHKGAKISNLAWTPDGDKLVSSDEVRREDDRDERRIVRARTN